ncbi:MAG: sugar ABC transporter ATP-binding protein [Acidobacteriota bacterium]|nr:sugar ABC transporter ATP-binding protein [Acidobacteriota bacterium]
MLRHRTPWGRPLARGALSARCCEYERESVWPSTLYNLPLLLEALGIEKRYGGVRALKHVSFGLKAGEVHAIIGENGAGKSTLIKVLTGAVQPDAGEVRLEGEPIADNNPHRSREMGIAAIYQQPAIFPDLTVAENIALAAESGRLLRRVNWTARRARAKELIREIGADIDPDREAGALSMPEQQLVEIAKALGGNVKALILDEPTASLTEREAERLFGIVERLREKGAGIIYISHRLEEVGRIADRITVLRDGETIETREARGTDAATLIRLMAGRELSAVFPKRAVPIGEVTFEVKRPGIELAVRAGEIVGIAGLVGSGRTELAESIFGLRPAEGTVRLNGAEITVRNPSDAIRAGIAYVPEDRRRNGVVGELPVRANTTLAILNRIASGTLLQFAEEGEIAKNWVERLGVKTDGIDAPASSLSGGNQQKVAIGRWLATEPKVLILDEPTQGIDVGAKSECHRIICDLAERGLAIVMISSELAEIVGMSDRVAVMHEGAIAGILDRSGAEPERILALALGHKA